VRFVMLDGASLEEAQDAAHEAFTESWTLMATDPAKWLAITNQPAWIRTVALRKYRRPPGPRIRPLLAAGAEIPDLPCPRPGPGETTVETQLVLQALRNIDEEARAVMAFGLDDFTTAEIAGALGITEQRVRDVRKKARAALKRALAVIPEGRDLR
jgi:DNA-directed RNA polymerase specialized sigma24 family protein